jgi:hypothetical protein
VSAYAVAACELVLCVRGEPGDVIPWVQAAARHTEGQPPGFDLIVILRAARLFAPILSRACSAPPR